jgi:hypothetical protein
MAWAQTYLTSPMKYCENRESRNDVKQFTQYKQTLQIYLHVLNKNFLGNPFRYSNRKSNSPHIHRVSQSILLNSAVMPENNLMSWLRYYNNGTTGFQHDGTQLAVRCGECRTNYDSCWDTCRVSTRARITHLYVHSRRLLTSCKRFHVTAAFCIFTLFKFSSKFWRTLYHNSWNIRVHSLKLGFIDWRHYCSVFSLQFTPSAVYPC